MPNHNGTTERTITIRYRPGIPASLHIDQPDHHHDTTDADALRRAADIIDRWSTLRARRD